MDDLRNTQQQQAFFGKPPPPRIDLDTHCAPQINCDSCPNVKCSFKDIVQPFNNITFKVQLIALPPRLAGMTKGNFFFFLSNLLIPLNIESLHFTDNSLAMNKTNNNFDFSF